MVIGGTNIIAQDFRYTPVYQMAGAMILTNVARGLELSNGGLKRVPLVLQILIILLASIGIWLGFRGAHAVREHYRRLREHHRQRHWLVRLRILPLNPIILHWVFAIAAHATGVALLMWALDRGYWGYLSAPAFAAAGAGAIQEVMDDEV